MKPQDVCLWTAGINWCSHSAVVTVQDHFVVFRLCDSIDVLEKNDVSNLYESLAENFAGVAQYNRDNRQFEGATFNLTLGTVCDIMVNESLGTPVKRYSLVNEKLLEQYNKKCLDYKYDKMITDLSQTDWHSQAAESGGKTVFIHYFKFVVYRQAFFFFFF